MGIMKQLSGCKYVNAHMGCNWMYLVMRGIGSCKRC